MIDYLKAHGGIDFNYCEIKELKEVLSFIDSLPEEKNGKVNGLVGEIAKWPDLSAFVKATIEDLESFGADRCCCKAEGSDYDLIITIRKLKEKKHEN